MDRRRVQGIELAGVVAAALLIAWLASATPRALPADAPADLFSAGRAQGDIARMAAAPHPIGSPENQRVRDQLLARLSGLGLQPRVQRVAGVRRWRRPDGRSWTVENIIAKVRGANPAAPAVLVLSHYDSVPGSPGAADDMAGVATSLETARLLTRGPAPRRDVLFVYTDGEEEGLLGAQAFFDHDPDAGHVGFVVNMDTRGGGGRALMFQTGEAAGAVARRFAAATPSAQSNSLAAFLYDRMPNNTDFTVARAHGLTGLNYAFIGRPALYHTPAATPAAVEQGAVQSLGDQVWAVVRPLAHALSLPPRAPGVTWFDLFGGPVVAYSPALGFAPLVAAAGLLAWAGWTMRRRGELAVGGVAAGAAQTLGAAVLGAALLYLYGRLAVRGYYQALGQAPRTETAIALCVAGASLLVFRASGASRRPLGRWLGAAAPAWLIAMALQVAAPPTAFLAEWPTLLVAVALAVRVAAGSDLASRVVSVVCAAVALGFLLETWHAVVLGVGLLTPMLAAILMPLALPALAPYLQRLSR